jgi:hypothetical protein
MNHVYHEQLFEGIIIPPDHDIYTYCSFTRCFIHLDNELNNIFDQCSLDSCLVCHPNNPDNKDYIERWCKKFLANHSGATRWGE